MTRTELLQEIRKMRFEEAYEGWQGGWLRQEEAARLLGVCERTFRRYIDRYEEEGLQGLIDKRLEQVSQRRAPVDEVMALVERYRSRHSGWNVKHFHAWYRKDGGLRSYTWVVAVDTFGGRVHVEWDAQAAVTPLGQLPFFIEFLQVSGRFDPWVESCPLVLTSPNAPSKRDVLGTAMLSILSGHRRYAHISALRGDNLNAPLLGMESVVSEDSVRRNLGKIDEAEGVKWLQDHLDACVGPLLGIPWILDVDVTVKPL